MRKCKLCKVEKSDSDFYKQASNTDGLQKWCKACQREIVRRNAKTDRGKAVIRRKTKKAYQNHSHKKLARVKLFRAVKMGKIIKPNSCQRCGSQQQIEAHHKDYAKPVDVEWYCQLCHKLVERGL